MMPMTPRGTRTRWNFSPLGRDHSASTVPTGLASSAISSTPVAMPAMRASLSSRRSMNAAGRPAARAASMSLALAARICGTASRSALAAVRNAVVLASGVASARACAASRARRPIASIASSVAVSMRSGLFMSLPLQGHVVAMDQLIAARYPQYSGDFGAFLADDALRVETGVGNESAPQFAAVRAADDHRVAAVEIALYARHAGRQQALARGQRLLGAGIDVHLPLRLELPGNPALARRHRVGMRQEPGARGALADGAQRVHDLAAGDHHVRA